MKKIKNPCSVCGEKTDAQGWCGSPHHDDGNAFGGIHCLTTGGARKVKAQKTQGGKYDDKQDKATP